MCVLARMQCTYIDTRIVKDTRIKEESPGTSLLIYDYLIAQPWIE